MSSAVTTEASTTFIHQCPTNTDDITSLNDQKTNLRIYVVRRLDNTNVVVKPSKIVVTTNKVEKHSTEVQIRRRKLSICWLHFALNVEINKRLAIATRRQT